MHTHNSFENLKPFVKWVGGKGSSVERLLQLCRLWSFILFIKF